MQQLLSTRIVSNKNMSNRDDFFITDYNDDKYIFKKDIETTQYENDYLERDNNLAKEKTRTSLRFDKFLLWQLELISRISKNLGIKNNSSFADIVNNLMDISNSSNDLSEKRTKELIEARKRLNVLFLQGGYSKKIVDLPSLTYSSDYIERTINLAIFNSNLLSVFEVRLLNALLSFPDRNNFQLINDAKDSYGLFRGKGLPGYNSGNNKDIYEMCNSLKHKITLNWIEIYRFFGFATEEIKIQKILIKIEEDYINGTSNAKEEARKVWAMKEDSLSAGEYDEYIRLSSKKEKDEWLKTYTLKMVESFWRNKHGQRGEKNLAEEKIEKDFRMKVELSKKQGNFASDYFFQGF